MNGPPRGYPIEFEQATSIHGSVEFFNNDNLCHKVKSNLTMIVNGCLESIFD